LERVNNKSKKEVPHDKPTTLKYGLNHVTYLIEQKKAKLVIIACDVDPIENVLFLPTLCKTMDIPYCIVNNKARLGTFVHKKTASCLAITDFKLAQVDLQNVVRICRDTFNNQVAQIKKPESGIKFHHREFKLRRLLNAEEAKKKQN